MDAKYKVLVAEDDGNLRDLLNLMFEADFELHFAETGDVAIKLLQKHVFDFVMLDINLPITNGLDICKFIQNSNTTPRPGVIILTATAVSLTMVVLKHENLHRTKAAIGIMTSAVLDDVATLILVAVLIPLVSGHSEPTFIGILMITSKALIFFVLVMVFAIWIFPGRETAPNRWGGALTRRFGLNNILAFSNGKVATLAILTLAMLFGIVAHYLGLHPAVGAYMAGLIMRKEYFYRVKNGETVNTYKKTRKIIDDVAFAWIGPVFFVNLGAKIVLDLDILLSIVDTTIILTMTIIVVQIISAGLAARYTGHFNFRESVMIGFGMLGRAELAFVVMDIGYVHNDIFTTEVFYTLMFTAFALNISVPICIKFWRPYFTGDKRFFWQNKNDNDNEEA